MISIPTYDLVTGLRNVLDFAPSARYDKQRAFVRLTCTGDALEISAYAVTHGAVSTWRPEQPVPGGLDDPWEILLSTTQAKRLAQNFELKSAKTFMTPVTLDKRGDTLHLSRPGDCEFGVDALRQSFQGSLEAVVPYVAKEFADLGDRTVATPVLASTVSVALGTASKRTGEVVVPVPHERGVRVTLGRELVVLARYPVEVDQDEADAQAIADAAVAEL